MKTWRGFTILDYEYLWFMGRGQNANIHRSLEDDDSSPNGRLCWVKHVSEEVTADVVGTAGEPRLEVEPERELNCCNLGIEREWTRSCFLWTSKEMVS